MPVGVYLRVSTEEQRERQSIETQRELAERYCGFQKLVVSQVYADDGISGTIPLDRRPEGSRILNDARLKKFDQLLIFKLDRLGRDARLILNYVAELESLGVRVKSLTEEFDTGTAGGRLMLTMLSGFAAHEREQIRERSIAGTNRIAETGAWLGGIVPFGYRKEGEKRNAKLLVADEPMQNFFMSEAAVVRTIYQMIAIEGKSCYAISDHLNRLGVPCAYQRDGRLLLLGKRKQNTAGLWRPARVRNLLVNTMYMGRHEYGKRSANPNRKLIARTVPAIVDEQTWKKAQAVLKSNWLFGIRGAKNQYLLRSLVKCELCNLTYIGLNALRPNGKRDFYYRCNGKHGARGLYGERGQRCPSKAINGDYLEQTIWADVETFLRNPGSVIEQLKVRFERQDVDADRNRRALAKLERAMEQKTGERDRVVGLYRKGRIGDAALDAQMDQIQQEENALSQQIATLRSALEGRDGAVATLKSTAELLRELRACLDKPLSWEVKRRLVELLVEGVRINTIKKDGRLENSVAVTYRFPSVVDTCTDRGSCNKRDLSMKPECRTKGVAARRSTRP